MEQKNHTIDSVALELFQDITENDDKKMEVHVGQQKICVLGNYAECKTEMNAIAKGLCDANYPATNLDKLPNKTTIPDLELEKRAMEKVELILIIDSDKGGVVSESTLLMENKHLMQKSVLFVPDTIPTDDLYSVKNHYVYYPTKVLYNRGNLVDLAISVAKQVSHRLALQKLSEIEGDKK
ncbi:MAG: hypothetical protein WC197_07075 [Candidatus Gastranaerophilaceae bacterium]|jgi:hypothetical protein